MKIGASYTTGTLALAVLLLTGCRDVVRSLQVNPDSHPQIVIFHHKPYRTAPVVYVLALEDDTLAQWQALSGKDRIVVDPKEGFRFSRGRLINNAVHIDPNGDIVALGQLELAADGITLELDARPNSSGGTHPINGRYRLTKADAVKVYAADGG